MHGNNGSPPPPTGIFDTARPVLTIFDYAPGPGLDTNVSWMQLLDSPVAFLEVKALRVPADPKIDIDFDDFGGFEPAAPQAFVDSPAGAIPSPGTLTLLALAALTLRGRRRRT